MNKIRIQQDIFDPWQFMAQFETELGAEKQTARIGATAVFVGTMRDLNEGDGVEEMTLEHYPGMTERIITEIVDQAIAQHGLDDARVVHRFGSIQPGEPIVLVAVWSGHRKAAFDACREIMEFLKAKAPFWKRERLNAETHRWVAKNTPG